MKTVEPAVQLESPPVGWPIQYFPRGDKTEPCAATVTDRYPEGQVKLNYQFVGGGENVSARYAIPHADTPGLDNRIESMRKSGTWDYIPGFPMPPQSGQPSRKTRFNPPPTKYQMAGDSRLPEESPVATDRRLPESKSDPKFQASDLPVKDDVFDMLAKMVNDGADEKAIARKAYGHGWNKKNVSAFIAHLKG